MTLREQALLIMRVKRAAYKLGFEQAIHELDERLKTKVERPQHFEGANHLFSTKGREHDVHDCPGENCPTCKSKK